MSNSSKDWEMVETGRVATIRAMFTGESIVEPEDLFLQKLREQRKEEKKMSVSPFKDSIEDPEVHGYIYWDEHDGWNFKMVGKAVQISTLKNAGLDDEIKEAKRQFFQDAGCVSAEKRLGQSQQGNTSEERMREGTSDTIDSGFGEVDLMLMDLADFNDGRKHLEDEIHTNITELAPVEEKPMPTIMHGTLSPQPKFNFRHGQVKKPNRSSIPPPPPATPPPGSREIFNEEIVFSDPPMPAAIGSSPSSSDTFNMGFPADTDSGYEMPQSPETNDRPVFDHSRQDTPNEPDRFESNSSFEDSHLSSRSGGSGRKSFQSIAQENDRTSFSSAIEDDPSPKRTLDFSIASMSTSVEGSRHGSNLPTPSSYRDHDVSGSSQRPPSRKPPSPPRATLESHSAPTRNENTCNLPWSSSALDDLEEERVTPDAQENSAPSGQSSLDQSSSSKSCDQQLPCKTEESDNPVLEGEHNSEKDDPQIQSPETPDMDVVAVSELDKSKRNTKLEEEMRVVPATMAESRRELMLMPLPDDGTLLRCYVETVYGGCHVGKRRPLAYSLFLESGDGGCQGIFLLSAWRKNNSHYISLDQSTVWSKTARNFEPGRKDGHALARLRRNWKHNDYMLYDTGIKPKGSSESFVQQGAKGILRSELASLRVLPRVNDNVNIQVHIPFDHSDKSATTWEPNMGERMSDAVAGNRKQHLLELNSVHLNYKRNSTVGDAEYGFESRALQTWRKNLGFTSSDLGNKKILEFGQLDRGRFALDFMYPLSPMQAFALSLALMDSST